MLSCPVLTSAQLSVEEQLNKIEQLVIHYPDTAEKELEHFNESTSQSVIEKYAEDIAYIKALQLYRKNDYDSALVVIKDILPRYGKQYNLSGQAKCQLLIGFISEDIGNWDQAIINYYKCVDLLEDQSTIYTGYANIGIARCNNYKKNDFSSTLEKGVQQLKENGSYAQQLFAEKSYLSLMNQGKPETFKKLDGIGNEYLQLNLNREAINIYKGLAHNYYKQRQYDSAEYYVDEALELVFSKNINNSLLPSLLQFKGALFYKKKDYDEAEKLIYQSIDSYDKYKLHSNKYYPYKLLSRIDTIKKDYQAAFLHLTAAVKYQKLKEAEQKKRLTHILNINAEVDALKEDNASLKSQRSMLIMAAIIGLLFVTMVAYYFINRNKKRQLQIKAKNKDLHNLVVGINEKLRMQKRIGIADESISNHKKNKLTLSENFDLCYQESYQAILNEYPQLTKADARYALMFALGMSTEAICQIQSVQSSTVRKAKSRVREKLNLSKDSKLEDYFMPLLEYDNQEESLLTQ
ncbi:tetratricopeptide repeat protein [Carboxylicivirga marina]|uniref:Tetratricopeptide repeat protein n=1 Tax=Carboxylicivirga marina TaxID=2800988 RepID=A0ABS1HG91_9BACT|nr:tetratricopeptide repeat protein [Carboxylicivirga marina]MBK3516635.1 tetratricopeptide repeat protein [Carboxylicivirga marina]